MILWIYMQFGFSSNNLGMVSSLKTRRRKFGIGSLIVLLMFGAAFTAIGLFTIKSTRIDPSWTRVNGTVVSFTSSYSNNSTTYTPVVQYQVNGRAYKVTAGFGSSSVPANGSIHQVAYNPAAPQQAKVVESSTDTMLLYLFPAVGVGLLIMAPVLFVRSSRRTGDINGLIRNGVKIQGVLADIHTTRDNGVNLNSGSTIGNMSYKIIVSGVDPSTGQVQNYISDSITGIGVLAMSNFRNSPIPIDVYIDRTNPKNYYVDVSDIPNLTPERITEMLKSVATPAVAPVPAASSAQETPASPVAEQPAGPTQTPPTNPAPPAG